MVLFMPHIHNREDTQVLSMLTGPVYNGELYVGMIAFGSLCLFLVHTTGDDDVLATFCAVISFTVATTGLIASVAIAIGYVEFAEISPAGAGGRIALNILWVVNVALAAAIGYLLITKRNTAPIPSNDPSN